MNPFAPLGDRDFRLYFAGEVLSTAGSGLHIVALGWYLLDRTGSATSVALVWALGLGSGIFMLPVAGPLADRYPRRMLAVSADIVRLVLVGIMAALAYAGSPPVLALYALTFAIGLAHSVFWPSITALLQEVIRPEQLTAASGLVEIVWQAGSLTGAALGGPILVRYGLGTAFAIDASTYALSAAALLALHHRPAPAEGPHESGLVMARAGISYLRRHRAIAGFCSSAFRVITNAYLFKVVPNDVMGRTSSTLLLVSMLLQVGVTLGVGPLVNHAGARGGFALLAAIVGLGLVLLVAVAPAVRRVPVRDARPGPAIP